MSKKKDRFVRVDNGYGPASRYETVKVISSRKYKGVFGEDRESLLVEACDGERYWADYWEEINDKV